MAQKLSDNISEIITDTPNGFVRWALMLAPVAITHPDPKVSGIPTFAAAEDGYVYVNPSFWNAVNEKAMEDPNENVNDNMRFFLLHEVGHHFFKHTWGRSYINGIAQNNNLPPQYVRHISNICQDYIINSFCMNVYPNAEVAINNGITSPQKLLSSLENLGVNISSFENKIANTPVEKFTWDELLDLVIENVDQDKMPDLDAHQNLKTAMEGSQCNSGQGLEQEQDENNQQDPETVQGVHGEKINKEKKTVAREGINKQDGNSKDSPSELWDKAKKMAVLEARRNAGFLPGRAFRQINSLVEIKVPWEKAVKTKMKEHIDDTNVLSSWSKASRRNSGYPGNFRLGKGDVWLLTDTSGSVSDEDLRNMVGVGLNYIKKNSNKKLKLIPWDANAYQEIIVKNNNDLDKISKIKGGGGTRVQPALEAVLRNKREGGLKRSDVVVICTDSELFISEEKEKKEINDLIKKTTQRTGNKILWFNVGAKSSAENIVKNNKETVMVHLEDFKQKTKIC